MQKTHCRDCQGTELYDTVLSARNGVIIGRKTNTGDEWIMVRCLICLHCGYTMPYISDDGLERLRHWAYPGIEAAAPYAAPDNPGDARQQRAVPASEIPVADSNPAPKHEGQSGFGTIAVICLIVGTILGLLVVFYGMTHE